MNSKELKRFSSKQGANFPVLGLFDTNRPARFAIRAFISALQFSLPLFTKYQISLAYQSSRVRRDRFLSLNYAESEISSYAAPKVSKFDLYGVLCPLYAIKATAPATRPRATDISTFSLLPPNITASAPASCCNPIVLLFFPVAM